jgi:hypothetical protein
MPSDLSRRSPAQGGSRGISYQTASGHDHQSQVSRNVQNLTALSRQVCDERSQGFYRCEGVESFVTAVGAPRPASTTRATGTVIVRCLSQTLTWYPKLDGFKPSSSGGAFELFVDANYGCRSQPDAQFGPKLAQRNLQIAANENMQALLIRHRPWTAFYQTTIFNRAKLLALIGGVVVQHDHDFASVVAGSPVKIIRRLK